MLGRGVIGVCAALVALAVGSASAPGAVGVTVKLKPLGGSGVSGTAVLTTVGGKLRVVVKLNKPVRGSLPAHLHIGSCSLAPNMNIRAGLTNVVRGRSVTVAEFTTLAQLRASKHSVHVHDLSYAVVACGDVPRA